MIKENLYKKISLFLAVILLANILLPTTASAQISINPTYKYEGDVRSFDNNIEDAAADCMADALINGIIGKIGGSLLGDVFGGGGMGDTFGGGGMGLDVPVISQTGNKISSDIKKDTSAQVSKDVGTDGLGSSSLDSIAFCLANKAIYGIVSGTSKWVREGFGGNPVFVNNPGKYFGDIADYELGRLLDDISKDLLCVNININSVKSNIFRDYYGKLDIRIPRCALGTINIDIDAFSQGNLSQGGGWEAWLEYTSDPYSNYIGTQIALDKKLYERTIQAQEKAKVELDWNNGYQSLRNKEGDITTTGNMIQAQVEGRMNAPINRLTFADEFDEIMNNLINSFLGSVIGD